MKPNAPRVLATAALALAVTAASAQMRDEPVTGDRGSDMVVDALLVRPVGLAATVVGAVVWVVALPFTLPSGSVGDAGREFVVKPAEYTFNRPLGDFDRCGADRHPCGYGR